jgi:hypothetical protein
VTATIRSIATGAGVDVASIVVNKPGGAGAWSNGDLLIAIQNTTADVAADTNLLAQSGWSTAGSRFNTAGTLGATSAGMNGAVWYRTAGASEPASYTFSGNTSTDGNSVTIICITAGTYNPASPFAALPVWGGSDAVTQTAQVAPTISPSVADSLMFSSWSSRCFNNLCTYTPPGTMTERADYQPAGNYIATSVASETRAASGATGTRTATATRSSNYAAVSLAIAPATGGNSAPTANAGADQANVEPWTTVTLTGTDSDSDGTISTRTWTQLTGTSVTLSGSGASRTFEAPGLLAGATLTFRYSVTDNGGATTTDDVSVVVLPVNESIVSGGVLVPLRIIPA